MTKHRCGADVIGSAVGSSTPKRDSARPRRRPRSGRLERGWSVGDETVVDRWPVRHRRRRLHGMRKYPKQWPHRVWAIEGCQGIGRHITNRLLADGEQVDDVPPKLSAQAGMFATGQDRKTDATDAHSNALVGTRMAGCAWWSTMSGRRPGVRSDARPCGCPAGQPVVPGQPIPGRSPGTPSRLRQAAGPP